MLPRINNNMVKFEVELINKEIKSALMQCAYCGGNQSFTGAFTGSNRCTGWGLINGLKELNNANSGKE